MSNVVRILFPQMQAIKRTRKEEQEKKREREK
jgi:hypothetical protein